MKQIVIIEQVPEVCVTPEANRFQIQAPEIHNN